MYEIEATITGKVQGVSFRAYAQDAAGELELTGFVKNQPDGSVLVCAQGMQDALKAFVEYLHEGSLNSKVESVSVDWKTVKNVYDDFSVIYE